MDKKESVVVRRVVGAQSELGVDVEGCRVRSHYHTLSSQLVDKRK